MGKIDHFLRFDRAIKPAIGYILIVVFFKKDNKS
jgi:hypothetical protein